jgi:hypothetical protein
MSNPRRGLIAALTAAGVGCVALMFASVTQDAPLLALAVPGILATAVVCARWPAAALATVLVFSGTFGSLQAFGLFSPGLLVDLLLAGLLVGLLISHAVNERERPWWIWPGMALTCLYILITFFEIATALSVRIGFEAFRYSAWYMLVLPLVALAGWRLGTYVRLSKAIVAITLLVAGYAVLRLVIGASSSEQAFAVESTGVFNVVDGELKLIGSFTGRHQLAFWVTCAAPFCLAAALAGRGLWKVAALVATGLCFAATFGTEVRVALPALLAGSGAVILLFQLSGGLGGPNLGRTVTVSAIVLAVGAGLFTWVLGDSSDRYSAIFSPSGDISYEQRLIKWDQALADIEDAPFGNGLGSAGRVQELAVTPYRSQGAYNIDSSYLLIAYQQGFPVLALFAAAMLALLAGLARQAMRVGDGVVRGIAIGGVGTLAAGLAMFASGEYIDGLIAVALWIPVGAAVGAVVSQDRPKQGRPQRASQAQASHAEPPLGPSSGVGAPA